MKKSLIISVLFVLSLFLLAGCKSAGKAINMPVDPSQPGFGIERGVTGTTVTLQVYEQSLSATEIVIVAEKLPDGVSYVEGSASVAPMFHDSSLLIWLFAKNAPQALGVRTINDGIPNTISYMTNTAPATNEFLGKWGLKELNWEGNTLALSCTPSCAGKECGNDGCGGSCVNTCAAGEVCVSNQCATGCIDLVGLMNKVTEYLAGTTDLVDLMNAVQLYLDC